MIYRLILTPLNNVIFNNEYTHIYNIASNNGYNTKIIKKLFIKIKKNHTLSQLHALIIESKKIYKRIPFISNHITYPIANNLRKHGITPALYNINNLSSQLINNKLDKIVK